MKISNVLAGLGLVATLASSGLADTKPFVPNIKIDPEAFVEGNLYFLAYHELGHALISEFEIPVAGREEDAVDRLATYMMTPEDKSPPDYLMAAMRGWFMTAAETPLNKIEWWDEHGTDQQRGYQIACLLYGNDPKRYKNIAEVVKLPNERRDSCEIESNENDRSWDGLLDSFWHAEIPEAERTKINVVYEPAKDFADEIAYLKEIGVLEDLRRIMAEHYKFKPGIRVEAAQCDEANAFWNAEERRITICYELVADFREIAENLKK